MAELNERASSTVNPKIHSDSGYGSNKSNCQSQRSSGSSKSQQSSFSSGSGGGYPPHPNAPVLNADCQLILSPVGGPGSTNSTKRQGKKKNKLDRRPSYGEKNDSRMSHDSQIKDGNKGVSASQPMDQKNISMPNTPQPLSQLSPASRASSNQDSKALQVAALTHALSCMKKFQDHISESEMNYDSEDCTKAPKVCWQKYIAEEFKDSSNEDTFATVVSLDDGVVVYLTLSISNILGFPRDMLMGRSFIDFIHPKDRMAFASHITSGINFPIGDQTQHMQNMQGPTVKSEPFYCRLRQYRGLKSAGFGITDKTVVYHPFKLSMQLKKIEGTLSNGTGSRKVFGTSSGFTRFDSVNLKETSSDAFGESTNSNSSSTVQNAVYLVIEATRIKSAYQYSEEIPKNSAKFVTRHSASCHFGHMDAEAISYLGHMPQDLIGNSVLDYYHPEDMLLIKDIYEAVMQEQGKPFRSKPYRFRVFNGSFAMLETDWSCFINPWSWKLEFVIGQHRVVQGPGNPDVFKQPKDDCDEILPGEVIFEAKELQNEIRQKLTETVTRRLSDRQQSSRRRKDLAALMETLLEQMAKTENSDKSGSQCSGFSVMERDSAMLGEISPHTVDNSGSNHSSSTPPSYNQLNYRENIQRFFQSQPKTERSDESGESSNKMDTQNQSSESDSKSSPNIDYSSGSNIRTSSGSNESGNDQESIAFGSGSLTQELLTRHNEDMEKYMMQRHRLSRGKCSMTPVSKDSRHRHSEFHHIPSSRSMDDSSSELLKYSIPAQMKKNAQKCETTNGLKRTGNFSWDGDSENAAKQPHLDQQSEPMGLLMGNSNNIVDGNGVAVGITQNSINLWPPFSISMTPGVSTSPSYRYTYPSCNVFANTSLAGYNGNGISTSEPGVCIPGFPHLIEQQQPLIQTSSIPPVSSSANVSILENSPAPFYLLPGQQQQFVSQQQVQLMPAGIFYQPISPYGQHPQFLLPLGTMINPGQPVFMGSSTGGCHVSSNTSVLPPSSLNLITLPTPPVSISGSSSSSSRGILSTADFSFMKLASSSSSVQISSTVTSPPINVSSCSSSNYSGVNLKTSTRVEHPSTSCTAVMTSKVNDRINKLVAAGNYAGNSSCDCSGSGSDESMIAVSLMSKRSKEDMEQEQFNSDQSMNSENCNEKLKKQCSLKNVRNKEPPWLQNVSMTPDLAFRFSLPTRDMNEVLENDLQKLKLIAKQSPLVNDQLTMLYSDLANEGASDSLHIDDEGISSSSGEELASKSGFRHPKTRKKKMSLHQYCRLVMIHEENAPFPPDYLISTSKTNVKHVKVCIPIPFPKTPLPSS